MCFLLSKERKTHTTDWGCCSFLSVRNIFFFASHPSHHLVPSTRSRLHSWHSLVSIRTDQTWRGCASPVTLSRSECYPIEISRQESFRNAFPTLDNTICRFYLNYDMKTSQWETVIHIWYSIYIHWLNGQRSMPVLQKFSLFCSELVVWNLLLLPGCIPVWIPSRVELSRKPRSSVHETWICMLLINMYFALH